jgi:hypothetical protein
MNLKPCVERTLALLSDLSDVLEKPVRIWSRPKQRQDKIDLASNHGLT